MANYTAKYGHQMDCTPGQMTIEADSIEDAIKAARKFVEDGFRDMTWINLDLNTAAYSARNKHGKAVGQLTNY